MPARVRTLIRKGDIDKAQALNDIVEGLYLRIEALERRAVTGITGVSPITVSAGTTPEIGSTAAASGVAGHVTAAAQTFTGAKTFEGAISASNLSGTNTGDVTLAAVGSSPNANGATLSGSALNLEPASSTQPGIISTATQTIPGVKIFNSQAELRGGAVFNSGATSKVYDSSNQLRLAGGANGIKLDDEGFAADCELNTTPAVVTPSHNGALRRGFFKAVIPYTEFDSTAGIGPTAAVLASIPAKTRVVSVVLDVTTAFNVPAGATGIQIACGYTGSPEVFIVYASCAATTVLGDADAELGTGLARATAVLGGHVPSWTSSALQLSVSVQLLTGGSLVDLTQGSVTVYVLTERMD